MLKEKDVEIYNLKEELNYIKNQNYLQTQNQMQMKSIFKDLELMSVHNAYKQISKVININ